MNESIRRQRKFLFQCGLWSHLTRYLPRIRLLRLTLHLSRRLMSQRILSGCSQHSPDSGIWGHSSLIRKQRKVSNLYPGFWFRLICFCILVCSSSWKLISLIHFRVLKSSVDLFHVPLQLLVDSFVHAVVVLLFWEESFWFVKPVFCSRSASLKFFFLWLVHMLYGLGKGFTGFSWTLLAYWFFSVWRLLGFGRGVVKWGELLEFVSEFELWRGIKNVIVRGVGFKNLASGALVEEYFSFYIFFSSEIK